MRRKIFYAGILLASITLFNSCQKESTQFSEQETGIASKKNDNENGHLKQAKTFNSDLVVKWLDVQLDMLRVPLAAGTGSQASDRCQAYCGIAIYEAVVNGMPEYQSLAGQLIDFPEMPETEPGKAYHWGASANAALAEMNRKLFPSTSDANKTSINNLENSIESGFASEVNTETLQRSIAFGREVATRIFAWAATDGSANVNPPYIPPVGFGLWVPTALSPPALPYGFQHRFLVPGSSAGTAIEPPPPFSTDPSSPFWAMAKEVYDKSFVLTPDQIASAIYNRDAPGYPGGGHFVAILSQVLNKAKPTLDQAALCYAKVGISQRDATIVLFTKKYAYKTMRPITYIQNVMGFVNWSPLIPTPNHPEFPAGHAVTSSAVLGTLDNVFGDNFQFTLSTYDYLGFSARSYNSFNELIKEMSDSRVYAGIHYQSTCDNSIILGRKVSENVLRIVKFHK